MYAPATMALGIAGGELVSADGRLTLTFAPGTVSATTDFSVQAVTNTAPGAVGPAYRLGPEGAALGKPVTLSFAADASDPDFGSMTIATQRVSGFWVTVEGMRRDPAAQTLTVTTNHFSDWSPIRGYPYDTRDLYGTYGLTQTTDIPFTATGTAKLYLWNSDASGSTYLLTGDVTVPGSIAFGTSTCVPDATTLTLPDCVAETVGSPTRFRWGINGYWKLSCTDGSGQPFDDFMATSFDSLGINLVHCSRDYVGAQTNDADNVVGDQKVDCAAKGYVEATWDFHSCTAAGEGTPCGSGMTCQGGLCKP